jgi:glyoxylase-like metal-dependent hydrolase (beta-lactamase superfamily II)
MKFTSVLPLEFNIGDFKTFLNPVVLKDHRGLVLVDCGNPGFLPKIEAAMKEAGLNMGDVKKIIITHHDGDHIGALKAIFDKYPGIEVLSSKEQAPHITGKQKPLRMTIAEEKLSAATSDKEKREMEEEIQRLSVIETIDRVTVVKDGDVLPECGGLEIIDTSGHMPGHICVYVKEDKVLISGDALTAMEGKLSPPDPRFTLDMEAAIQSAKKLLHYDIEHVVCYHGGLVSGGIRDSLLRFSK